MMDPKRKSGIFWIASYPKSGNTWLRAFLQNLVQIMRGVDEEQSIGALERFCPWDARILYYTKYLSRPFENDLKHIAPIRHLVQRDFANRSSGLVFVKTHWALGQFLGYGSIDFSITAGALYIVRNPLDVAISFAHHMEKPIDFAIEFMCSPDAHVNGGGETVVDFLGSWSQHVDSWTREPNPNVCVVRYEDMLADPEVWFGVLSRHIFNPAPTPEQIRKAIDRSSFQKLRGQEEKLASDTKRYFREGRAGQWTTSLTALQCERITSAHGKQMARFGYLLNG
jgi:Sulfotransferase domain